MSQTAIIPAFLSRSPPKNEIFNIQVLTETAFFRSCSVLVEN